MAQQQQARLEILIESHESPPRTGFRTALLQSRDACARVYHTCTARNSECRPMIIIQVVRQATDNDHEVSYGDVVGAKVVKNF